MSVEDPFTKFLINKVRREDLRRLMVEELRREAARRAMIEEARRREAEERQKFLKERGERQRRQAYERRRKEREKKRKREAKLKRQREALDNQAQISMVVTYIMKEQRKQRDEKWLLFQSMPNRMLMRTNRILELKPTPREEAIQFLDAWLKKSKALKGRQLLESLPPLSSEALKIILTDPTLIQRAEDIGLINLKEEHRVALLNIIDELQSKNTYTT